MTIFAQPDPFPDEPALGIIADYRSELHLAIDRALKQLKKYDSDVLYSGSLLDSVAYAATNVWQMVNNGSASEAEQHRWNLTLHMVGCILRDSYVSDLTIFLPTDSEDEYDQAIENSILAVLNEFNVEYNKLTNADEAATLILKFLEENDVNGSGEEGVNPSSNEEDD